MIWWWRRFYYRYEEENGLRHLEESRPNTDNGLNQSMEGGERRKGSTGPREESQTKREAVAKRAY